MSHIPKMAYKPKITNLTALQMNNITALKRLRKKITNLSNFRKQYFDWIQPRQKSSIQVLVNFILTE